MPSFSCEHCGSKEDLYTVGSDGILCETCIDNGYTFDSDGTLIQLPI